MSLRGSARRREIQLAYLLLSPALLLLLTVLAYPVGWELWTSLTDLSPLSDGPQAFVGFENYRRFLGEAEFWRAAAVTVVYAAVTSGRSWRSGSVSPCCSPGHSAAGPSSSWPSSFP